jgi:hypothetical protein
VVVEVEFVDQKQVEQEILRQLVHLKDLQGEVQHLVVVELLEVEEQEQLDQIQQDLLQEQEE